MDSHSVRKKTRSRNGIKRMVFCILSLLLSIGLWFFLFYNLRSNFTWVSVATNAVALFLSLWIYSQDKTSSMKMPWIILMLTFPFFGVFCYFLIGYNVQTKKMKQRYADTNAALLPLLPQNEDVLERFRALDASAGNIAAYIYRNDGYPLYADSGVEYYSDAADALEAQLDALSKAEKFIFMEYHAIEDAESWSRIQKVLEERSAAGVEVRVFYDDAGSIGFVNTDFAKYLRTRGIHCRVFNPFKLGVTLFLNNRDHRKITVIDGKVGFTGGYNLADEYFNITSPYGLWKDTGIKISGPAAASLTAAFLEMWNSVFNNDEDIENTADYLPAVPPAENAEGYIAPYAVNPLSGLHIGEDVYISMLDKATDYCWFITPYLILSDEMIHAMSLAAMRGVDVRIITPGIPDKKVVYKATRSFYPPLAKCGVRIFEWTPGFCHAKMCVADDKMAACGTINLDFRSLYHHFENGCFFYGCKAVADVKADFEKTFSQCREVTDIYCEGRSSILTLLQLVLRLFAELL